MYFNKVQQHEENKKEFLEIKNNTAEIQISTGELKDKCKECSQHN